MGRPTELPHPILFRVSQPEEVGLVSEGHDQRVAAAHRVAVSARQRADLVEFLKTL